MLSQELTEFTRLQLLLLELDTLGKLAHSISIALASDGL